MNGVVGASFAEVSVIRLVPSARQNFSRSSSNVRLHLGHRFIAVLLSTTRKPTPAAATFPQNVLLKSGASIFRDLEIVSLTVAEISHSIGKTRFLNGPAKIFQ